MEILLKFINDWQKMQKIVGRTRRVSVHVVLVVKNACYEVLAKSYQNFRLPELRVARIYFDSFPLELWVRWYVFIVRLP